MRQEALPAERIEQLRNCVTADSAVFTAFSHARDESRRSADRISHSLWARRMLLVSCTVVLLLALFFPMGRTASWLAL